MIVTAVFTTNGHQSPLDDKSRRHPRWTRQETLTLIQAKDITENGPHKGRKMSSALLGSLASSSSENTEPKWVMISSYCKQQGVSRGAAQCRKRWSNLIGDYKKVKVWESMLKDKAESFWIMRNDLRKENKLPVSFDSEVFKVLEGREMGAAAAVSPLPLQAVAAVSSDANGYGDYAGDEEPMDEEEIAEDEAEEESPERETEQITNGGEYLKVEDVSLSDSHGEEQELPAFGLNQDGKNTANNVTESLSKTPNPTAEQHHQAFEKPDLCSSQDALRDSWPGISYWDSHGKGKRRRLSTDDSKVNGREAHIIKVLEANNKMLDALLDVHNKNIQLDREQRKENNDVVVAALGKLTDVLVKMAEKL